jgi:hypothetical protein
MKTERKVRKRPPSVCDSSCGRHDSLVASGAATLVLTLASDERLREALRSCRTPIGSKSPLLYVLAAPVETPRRATRCRKHLLTATGSICRLRVPRPPERGTAEGNSQ